MTCVKQTSHVGLTGAFDSILDLSCFVSGNAPGIVASAVACAFNTLKGKPCAH